MEVAGKIALKIAQHQLEKRLGNREEDERPNAFNMLRSLKRRDDDFEEESGGKKKKIAKKVGKVALKLGKAGLRKLKERRENAQFE